MMQIIRVLVPSADAVGYSPDAKTREPKGVQYFKEEDSACFTRNRFQQTSLDAQFRQKLRKFKVCIFSETELSAVIDTRRRY